MNRGKYKGLTVVLGLTGGIACYKAVEVVSHLTQRGAAVHVIMTKAACQFITPLTLQTISNNQVAVDMFGQMQDWHVRHISLAEIADLLVIIPATANFIGKVAAGIADDLLTTTVMATRAPVLLAPAMNVNMYCNPIVQNNITKLEKLAFNFIEPDEGYLACGVEGKGRLAQIEKVIQAIDKIFFKKEEKSLVGVKVLVTAGGTQEPIDPVRFISNHSSGKMGLAICEALVAEGAEVVLVSGPTVKLPLPAGVVEIKVVTALEMYEQCLQVFPHVNAVIKAAAVADYRPKNQAERKIKKSAGDTLVLELERNPDILRELGKIKQDQIIIGFAAETEDLLENAREKLKAKKLDMIVANDVTVDNSGFNADHNLVTFLSASGKTEQLPLLPKTDVARQIVIRLIKLLHKE